MVKGLFLVSESAGCREDAGMEGGMDAQNVWKVACQFCMDQRLSAGGKIDVYFCV